MKKQLFALCLGFLFLTPSSARCNIDDDCQDIIDKFTQVQYLLQETLPLDTQFIISELPITLSQPGKYNVLDDLSYTGSGSAITVSGSNISINFHNHSLTIQNDAAVGIYAANINEFSLENDLIQGNSTSSVHLVNVNKGLIQNLYTTNKVTIENCSDVQLNYSQFMSSDGVILTNSSHVTVDSCTFHENGLLIDGPSSEVIVKNSSFVNCLSAINALKVEGLIVEDCKVAAGALSTSLIKLGDSAPNCLANDVLIRNSCFLQQQASPGFNGMLIVAGNGGIFENLVVDTVTSGSTTGAIHVNGSFEDLLAKGCIVKGQNDRSVYIEQGNKVVLEECLISDGQVCNVKLLQASSCTIKNCSIFDGNHGIHIDNTLGGGENSLKDNFIYNNEGIGIAVDDMEKNSITGNILWANGIGIQIAFSDYTETFFNTSCNNTQQNCINVYPSQSPGSSTIIPGANLCCE